KVAAQLAGTVTGSPVPSAAQATRVEHPVATGRAVGTVVGHAPTTTQPPPVTVSGAGPRDKSGAKHDTPLSPTAVVQRFYQQVATDPALASGLLSPSLLGNGSAFDQAWDQLSEVHVDSVQQVKPNTVEVAVRMLEPDGSTLRVVEL